MGFMDNEPFRKFEGKRRGRRYPVVITITMLLLLMTRLLICLSFFFFAFLFFFSSSAISVRDIDETLMLALSMFIVVRKDHRQRFTVVSHRGSEHYNVAAMGFKNSVLHIQRKMDEFLRPYRHFARCYIDDIIIFFKTVEEHFDHLRTVFRLFALLKITLEPKKSFLEYPSVTLLGKKVDGFGLITTEERVAAIKEMRIPETLECRRSFFSWTYSPITIVLSNVEFNDAVAIYWHKESVSPPNIGRPNTGGPSSPSSSILSTGRVRRGFSPVTS